MLLVETDPHVEAVIGFLPASKQLYSVIVHLLREPIHERLFKFHCKLAGVLLVWSKKFIGYLSQAHVLFNYC